MKQQMESNTVRDLITEMEDLCKRWLATNKYYQYYMQYHFSGSRGVPAGTYWSDQPYRDAPEKFDITELEKKHGSDSPWLYYDTEKDCVTIVGKHFYTNPRSGLLPLFSKHRNFESWEADRTSFFSAAAQMGLCHRSIQLPRENGTLVIYVLQGTIPDFRVASWTADYDRKQEQLLREKAEFENLCAETRMQVFGLLERADQLYNSRLIHELVSFHKIHGSGKYRYVEICRTHVSFLEETPDKNPGFCDSLFFDFLERGYQSISADDDLIAFTFAFVCRINEIYPSRFDLDQLIWGCQIKENTITLPVVPSVFPTKKQLPARDIYTPYD